MALDEAILRRSAQGYLENGQNIARASVVLRMDRKTLRRHISIIELEHPDWLAGSGVPMDIRAARGRAIRGEVGGPPIPDIAKPPEGFVIRRNSAEYDADGNLRKQWVESGQGNTDGWEVPPGHVVKGESVFLDSNGGVIGKWIKTREGAGEGLVDALRLAFAAFDGAAPQPTFPPACTDDVLTVYPVPDLHLGMYAWGPETGADYDVKIAVNVATQSIAHLVAQSIPSRRAIIVVLGDFFHANDQKNETPGSGHRLDVDSRWPLVYLAGVELVITLVDIVAAKHEEVEIVVLPGNHDPDAATTLAIAMSVYYSKIDRITVNITPSVAWYREFGKNLFGANHGHTIKGAEKMAMCMAVDASEAWGRTEHRYIWTGHLHHEAIKEVGGVRVETLSSPAARDAWNANSGYRSNRAMQGITFHRERGEIGRHRWTISGASPEHQQVAA